MLVIRLMFISIKADKKSTIIFKKAFDRCKTNTSHYWVFILIGLTFGRPVFFRMTKNAIFDQICLENDPNILSENTETDANT